MIISKEIKRFIKTIKLDYKSTKGLPSKKDKQNTYKRILKFIFGLLWNLSSALLIYPIWYIFRKQITKTIYAGTSWEEIEHLMQICEIDQVEKKLKQKGYFLFWLWTYGDCHDPLGRGGMPIDYEDGKNNFYNRYK